MAWDPIWSGGENGLRLAEPYTILNDVVTEINTRCTAKGLPLLDTIEHLMCYVDLSIASLGNLIYNKINDLIVWYDNPFDPPNKWTVGTITTYLGITWDTPWPIPYELTAEFFYKCYQILVLLI